MEMEDMRMFRISIEPVAGREFVGDRSARFNGKVLRVRWIGRLTLTTIKERKA